MPVTGDGFGPSWLWRALRRLPPGPLPDDGDVLTYDSGTGNVRWEAAGAGSMVFGPPTVTYGSAYAEGVAAAALRTDCVLKYPSALMTPTSSMLLSVSDDTNDVTLATSAGRLILAPFTDMLTLPQWTAVNGPPFIGQVLSFTAATSVIGADDLTTGIAANITHNRAGGTAPPSIEGIIIGVNTNSGPTYTGVTVGGLRLTVSGATLSGVHSFTARRGISLTFAQPLGASTTVTDAFPIDITGWLTIGTAGTYVNCAGIRNLLPTSGGTIRRGYWLRSGTGNLGTEAPNVEGFYCEAIPRGTDLRRSYAAVGHTTGTPTDVVIFDQETVHAVGTNRWFLRGLNASSLSNPSGIAQTVLALAQLNLGAGVGAHINFNDKAGDGTPVAGDLWRNGASLNYRKDGATTVDLAASAGGGDSFLEWGM